MVAPAPRAPRVGPPLPVGEQGDGAAVRARTGPPASVAHTDPSGTPSPLADLALLTLVVAHGTDADLDPRETRVLVRQLDLLAEAFGEAPSGEDLSHLVENAVAAYGRISVVGLDDVVLRLRDALDAETLGRAHAALVRVAEADEVVHTMEATFLRHLAQAWRLD